MTQNHMSSRLRDLPLLPLVLCVAILTPTASAQVVTYTWDGSHSQNWSNDSNWNSGGLSGLPDATDAIAFLDGNNVSQGKMEVKLVNNAGTITSREVGVLRIRTNAAGDNWHLKDGPEEGTVEIHSELRTDLESSGTAQIDTDLDIAANISWRTSGTNADMHGGFTGSGNITGTAASTGGITLHAAGTYSGTWTPGGGAININHIDALQSATLAINGTGTQLSYITDSKIGKLSGSGTLDLPSGRLSIGHSNATFTFAGTLTGGGHLAKGGSGVLTLSAASSRTGNTIVDGGQVVVSRADALGTGKLVVNTSDGIDVNGFDLTVGGLGGTGTIDLGGQTLTVRGISTFSGGFIGSGAVTLTGGGELTMNGASTSTAPITLLGSDLRLTDGSLASPVHVETGNTLNLRKTGDHDFPNTVSGPGEIRNTGAGVVTFTGTSTHSGRLQTGGGMLTNQDHRLGDGCKIWVSSISEFTFDGVTETVGSLNSSESWTGDDIALINDTSLTIGGGNSGGTFHGRIRGNGSIRKIGTATQTFGGSGNSYGGGTTVSAGTLRLNNTAGTGTGGGLVTVEAGATLAGSGGANGNVNVQGGGVVAPGAGGGTTAFKILNFGRNLTLAGTYRWEYTDGNLDRIEVSSTLNLNGASLEVIPVGNTGDPEPAWVIARYGTLVGTFAQVSGLPAGYGIDYQYPFGGNSNNIALVPDNTPPSIALNGSASVTLDFGTAWSDPGATATDALDGVVAVVIGGDVVDTGVAGSHIVTYDASDTAGNAAAQVTRTVTVRSAYQTWAQGQGLSEGVDDDLLDDPDDDDCANLMEFALDGDPRSGNSSGKLRLVLADFGGSAHLSLTLPVRSGASFSAAAAPVADIHGIRYRIVGGGAPGASDVALVESASVLSAGMPPLSTGWEYRTFRTAPAATNLARCFIEIEVSEP